jgi:hypothetical protein
MAGNARMTAEMLTGEFLGIFNREMGALGRCIKHENFLVINQLVDS